MYPYRSPMASRESLPIPVLLSRVLGHLTAAVEATAGVGSEVPPLAVWSNVLRCVADGGPAGLDEKDLPGAARLSSRMATAAITDSKRGDWITASPAGKSRRLKLGDRGAAAAKIWPECLAALDAEWKGRELEYVLEALITQLDLELPHFPASYGPADPSAIGGTFVARKEGGDLAHGKDWKPVRRADGETVARCPITALLSQALMAFTIDYENGFPWPLHSTLTRLVHIGIEPVPLRDLPPGSGVAGNGKSLLERHLIVEVTSDPADTRRKLVALTDRGVQVKQRHPARLEAVESEWRERFGPTLVDGLRDALTPLALGEAAGQPDHLMMGR